MIYNQDIIKVASRKLNFSVETNQKGDQYNLLIVHVKGRQVPLADGAAVDAFLHQLDLEKVRAVLSTNPEPDSAQAKFERLLKEQFNYRPGALGFKSDGSEYLNHYVNDLWVRFCSGDPL